MKQTSFLFCMLSLLGGCGSPSAPTVAAAPVAAPLAITGQPASQTIPLGLGATFSVAASGPTPLSYQWQRDAVDIAGAQASSYTTPPTALDDQNAVFAVVVSDGHTSVTSNSATLTVGARSPKAGDLRFQGVDAPYIINGYSGNGFSTDVPGVGGVGSSNSFGTPLALGAGSCGPDATPFLACAWRVSFFTLPSGSPSLSLTYTAYYLDRLTANLNMMAANPNDVITSLDIEDPSGNFAVAYYTNDVGGFSGRVISVDSASLPSIVASEAQASRVVTAVGLEGSQATALSYGWSSDSTTVYDAQVLQSSFANIVPTAQSLAQQGYILTALGGNPYDGYLLVGTKVAGDSLARSLVSAPNGQQPALLWTPGYAPVGILSDAAGNLTWIGER